MPLFAVLVAAASAVCQDANGLVATSTDVSSDYNPSVYSEPVTLTATVTPENGTIPDGETVAFRNGDKVIGTASTLPYTTSSGTD